MKVYYVLVPKKECGVKVYSSEEVKGFIVDYLRIYEKPAELIVQLFSRTVDGGMLPFLEFVQLALGDDYKVYEMSESDLEAWVSKKED